VQLLQARIAAIQSIDKALDLQLRRLDSQREAIQTELDSVKKVVTKNIQSTFKTFA
jgi:chaperonin cofactor prefoldin